MNAAAKAGILFILTITIIFSCGKQIKMEYVKTIDFNIYNGIILSKGLEKSNADYAVFDDSIIYLYEENNEYGFNKIILSEKLIFYNNEGINISKRYDIFCDSIYRKKVFLETNRCKDDYNIPLDTFIIISIAYQKLIVCNEYGNMIYMYPVSTSKYGIGSTEHSFKTPLGCHIIKDKIGDNAEKGDIFRFLKNTNEKAEIYYDNTDTENDYITTRLIRLMGIEQGKNKGNGIDTYDRHIYIHGTHEEGRIDIPSSHGCIRMKNDDVIKFYNTVSENTLIIIIE